MMMFPRLLESRRVCHNTSCTPAGYRTTARVVQDRNSRSTANKTHSHSSWMEKEQC